MNREEEINKIEGLSTERKDKFNKILDLMDARVLRELCPVSFNFRDTAYWHYEVVDPARLPEEFRAEYEELGEIRW